MTYTKHVPLACACLQQEVHCSSCRPGVVAPRQAAADSGGIPACFGQVRPCCTIARACCGGLVRQQMWLVAHMIQAISTLGVWCVTLKHQCKPTLCWYSNIVCRAASCKCTCNLRTAKFNTVTVACHWFSPFNDQHSILVPISYDDLLSLIVYEIINFSFW